MEWLQAPIYALQINAESIWAKYVDTKTRVVKKPRRRRKKGRQ
jgi:hypothetical protein